MAYSKTSSSGYSPIDKEQSDDEIETLTLTLAGENGKGTRHLAKTAPFLIVCIICGYILGDQFPIRSLNSHTPQSRGCVGPSIRREWRSSSDCEKQEYISAVQRLRNVPSRSNASQSLFDDFPYVHTLVGAYSHAAAAFSSWHRAFLHTYERALQADCGYSGTLAYWDWTLDWHNLTAAPVWSQTSGFGGDGDRNETNDEPIRGGYCVSHGPFAQLQVLYYGPWYRPHCLSWGFEHGHRLEVDGSRVKPEAIESLMKLNEYEDFNLQLKDGPHLAIPRVVNGDFALFTAPYDPVFLLRHTQLDRMWWLCQTRNWNKRGYQYAGLMAMNSTERAAVTDVLPLGGLAPDFTVEEIMNTEGTKLCYRY